MGRPQIIVIPQYTEYSINNVKAAHIKLTEEDLIDAAILLVSH